MKLYIMVSCTVILLYEILHCHILCSRNHSWKDIVLRPWYKLLNNNCFLGASCLAMLTFFPYCCRSFGGDRVGVELNCKTACNCASTFLS